MEKFYEEVVVPKMPLMLLNGKVKVIFAVWKHQPELNLLDGTWQYAIPKVEEMQGTCHLLII